VKKVLVTGAAGIIGRKVIGYLLSEGKYEITALDLRNKSSQKVLKKYRRRILFMVICLIMCLLML